MCLTILNHFRQMLVVFKYSKPSRGRDRMVVGKTTTYSINAYHHWCYQFESRSGRGVQHYVIKFKPRLSGIQTHVNGVNLIRYARNQKIGQPNNFARLVRFMVFNNISVISWRSVLLVEETGVPGENHRPVETRKSLTLRFPPQIKLTTTI
jgi:hypothetical protein